MYHKCYLPNYSVFDEQRYFASGKRAVVIDLDGLRIGVTICEDLWHPGWPRPVGGHRRWGRVNRQPVGLTLPSRQGNRARADVRDTCSRLQRLYRVFNAVGGQDELVFDGHSVIIDPTGKVLLRGRQFEEELLITDLDLSVAANRRLHDPRWRQRLSANSARVQLVTATRSISARVDLSRPKPEMTLLEPETEVYQALMLGTSDYFRKNGFRKAVLGLSGGIDSALSLIIAVDALGAEAVTAISMPSRFTADTNREDAATLSDRLGVPTARDSNPRSS